MDCSKTKDLIVKLNIYLFLLVAQTFVFQAHAKPCESKEYRQFDFWIGTWQVSNTQNEQVSHSEISLINDGCSLLEEYSTPSGYTGKSLNSFNFATKLWHQTWADNSGLVLTLHGQFNGKSMILSNHANQNSLVLNQITWTPNDNGTVRQHWQTSEDNGKTWQTAFDGLYTKLK
jgi:hypothetical protein